MWSIDQLNVARNMVGEEEGWFTADRGASYHIPSYAHVCPIECAEGGSLPDTQVIIYDA